MSMWASRCGIIGKPKPSFYRSPNLSPIRFQSHNPTPIPMQPRMAAMWQKMLSPSSGDSAYRPLYSRYCRYMREAAPRTININGDNIIMKASMTPMIGFKKETILIIVILRDYLFYLQRSSPLSTLLCSALFSTQRSSPLSTFICLSNIPIGITIRISIGIPFPMPNIGSSVLRQNEAIT